MSRRRIVVAALASTTDETPTLRISRAHLRAGEEVVHLGSGLETAAVVQAAVAEDAVHVVLVGADPAELQQARIALDDVDAADVTLSTD